MVLLFQLFGVKGASGLDALIVLGRMGADDVAGFHGDAEVVFGEFHRFCDGEVGIPLAAARSAHGADCFKSRRGHFVGKSPRFGCKGR